MKDNADIIKSEYPLVQYPSVLFIHSMVHPAANVVSAGAICAMNLIKEPKLGLYSNEVTDKHIKNAKILVMDIYWYFPIYHVTEFSSMAKSINPDIKIIVGGYTAIIYASFLVKKTVVDYAVKGDGHVFMGELIQSILSGDDPDLPGIVSAAHPEQCFCQHDPQRLDSLDFLTISWFPGLVRRVLTDQKTDIWTNYDDDAFPFIPISSGCTFDCDYCYGSPGNTNKLYGRKPYVRSPEAIHSDLQRCQQSPDISKVFIVGDMLNLFNKEELLFILEDGYDLDLYFDFFNLPEKQALDFLISGFRRCHFTFSLRTVHGEGNKFHSIEKLRDTLKHLPSNVLGEVFTNRNDIPAKMPKIVKSKLRVNDSWHIPVPQPKLIGTDQQAEEFRQFMNAGKSFFEQGIRTIDSVVTGLYTQKQKPLPKSMVLLQIDPQTRSPHNNAKFVSNMANVQRLVIETPYYKSGKLLKVQRSLGPEFIRNNKYRMGSAVIEYRCEELFSFFLKIIRGDIKEFLNLKPWERIQLNIDTSSEQSAAEILNIVPVKAECIIKPEIIFIMRNVIIEDTCRFLETQCHVRKHVRMCISSGGKTGYCRADTGKINGITPKIVSNTKLTDERGCKKCPERNNCSRCPLPVVKSSTYCRLKTTNGISTLLKYPLMAALHAKEK